MTSNGSKRMREFLEKIELEQYFGKFVSEGIKYSDLSYLEDTDVQQIIPKAFHRRKFFDNVEFLTQEKETNKGNNGLSDENTKNGNEETVDFHVKFGREIKKIYDIPISSTNEELIGRVVQNFMECSLTMSDKRVLLKEKKSFSIKKWCEQNGVVAGSLVRAVLKASGGSEEKRNEEKKKAEGEDQSDSLLLAREKELEKMEQKKNAWKTRYCKSRLTEADNSFYGFSGMVKDWRHSLTIYNEIERFGELDGNAYYHLSRMYFLGNYGVVQNISKAKFYEKKFIEYVKSRKVDDLNPADWVNLGLMCIYGGTTPEFGTEVHEIDEEKGLKLLERAANSGHAHGLLTFANELRNKEGNKCIEKVMGMYEEAAEGGATAAYNKLGAVYMQQKQFKKAVECFRKAVTVGERTAFFNLGGCFLMGKGVKKNDEEAAYWFQRAADLGIDSAKKQLEKMKNSGQI